VIETDNKLIGMAVFVIALILAMAWAVTAQAEDATQLSPGQVYVKVIDEDGNAVANATVQAITNTSQIAVTGLTNAKGVAILTIGTNFTGIIKVTADDYKTAQVNITFNNTKSYAYTFILKKDTSDYVDKAKDFYNEHKTAVIAGGAIIFLLLILAVMGSSKKIRW